ncbi:MAG: sugar-binding transcriptional regulator [Anaerolineaceae bacterium]|nr:sugar-binding transcriptional regulator [Anaerolineaceae bacterium]
MAASVEIIEQKKIRQLELLAEVASMYYEQELSQNEIADKFYISRSRVSRLLTMAKEKGIVTFKIHHTGERSFELEQMLKRKYHLDEAFVLNSNSFDYSHILHLMGVFAARYINNQLRQGQIIGISWGKSIAQTIEALKPDRNLKLETVQIIGGTLVQNPVIDIPALTHLMVDKFNATGIYLNAPLYMDNLEACCRLKEQPAIAFALNKARNADMIITGIGEVSEETFSYLLSGFDNSSELDLLCEKGAVGFICAQAFDINGEACYPEFNQSIVGVSLDELKNAKNVVAVSGGKRKGAAVLGALRGGYVKVLVTDLQCVQEVVRLDK